MTAAKLVISFALIAAGGAALACTGMYAGRKVTVDGTILIGRTVDIAPLNTCFRMAIVNRGEADPNDGTNAVPAKYRFVCTPSVTSCGRGTFHSAAVNELGFAISGTVTGDPNGRLDPCKYEEGDNWVGEHNLTGIVAGNAATAREGVKVLGETVARRKHVGGEIYMMADRDEAWYVEVYSARQWAAVRMPDDKVSCFGNQFMLRSFDPDAPDTMHSPELVSLPEREGKIVRGADGKIDLCRTYARELRDYGNLRTWYGHKVFAPSTAGEYVTTNVQPLFFSPDYKISPTNMFELMRCRYEGTKWCPEEGGDQDVRIIGVTRQATCHVIAVDPRLPAAFAGTIWTALANCEHSVFLPVNASVTRLDPSFTADQKGEFGYDPAVAGNHFRRLCALAEKDRRYYGSGIRAFWRARETELVAAWPDELAAAAKLGADGAEKLTEACCARQSAALGDAKRMLDGLLWFMAANNGTPGDGGPGAHPRAPYKP